MSRGLGSGGRCGSDRCASVNGAIRCAIASLFPCCNGKVCLATQGKLQGKLARSFGRSLMAGRLDKMRRKYEYLLRRVFHSYFLLARGMTLGVRAVVLDRDNRVFLVRHSYVN